MTPAEARVGARVRWEGWGGDFITGAISALPEAATGTVLVEWDGAFGGHSTWTDVVDLRLLPVESQPRTEKL